MKRILLRFLAWFGECDRLELGGAVTLARRQRWQTNHPGNLDVSTMYRAPLVIVATVTSEAGLGVKMLSGDGSMEPLSPTPTTLVWLLVLWLKIKTLWLLRPSVGRDQTNETRVKPTLSSRWASACVGFTLSYFPVVIINKYVFT